jgi:hypothetical protein
LEILKKSQRRSKREVEWVESEILWLAGIRVFEEGHFFHRSQGNLRRLKNLTPRTVFSSSDLR